MELSLVGKPISKLHSLLESKQVSAREITKAHLDHLKDNDSKTNAFLHLTEELAFSQADLVDNKIAKGEALSPLSGIPIAIKDNICVEGYPNTCASKILENFTAPYTATSAKRLFDNGAICIGKANMDEFAMGSSSENTAFDVPKNPWNLDYVAGGSSGGPAISVASGYSVIGIGSDTGGSIRLPASFCGVVGMKPTYGLVSRFGLVAYASSLDQIGPFANCVKDAASTLAVLLAEDSRDSTSLKSPFINDTQAPDISFAKALNREDSPSYVKDLKIGVISDFMTDALQSDVRDEIDKTKDIFTKLGACVEEVSIPHITEALPVYYIIATAEASANLARFDGVRYGARNSNSQDITSLYNLTRKDGFGDEVKLRIMLGTYALSTGYYDAYYKKAQQVRRLIKESFDQVFQSYDILISPTAPTTAFKIGDKTEDPLKMYLTDIATLPANLAGMPAISVPVGFSNDGLPIGIQLLGAQLSDALLLKAAFSLECALDSPVKLPPLLENAY